MRLIAAVTAVMLLGVFPSLTASQTAVPPLPSAQPYRPPEKALTRAPNVLRPPIVARENTARQNSAFQSPDVFQPAAAYQPAPSPNPSPARRPAPADFVMPSSHTSAANPNVMADQHQPRPVRDKTAKTNRTDNMKLGASRKGKDSKQTYERRDGMPSLLTIGSSLALVIGIFLVVAFLMRRATPAANSALPDEVVEVLGRAPLANRQQVHLLRCGNKLLLVCVTPNGTETLTEITDPAEVDRLAAICRKNSDGSASANFRQVFQQLSWANEPPEPAGGRR